MCTGITSCGSPKLVTSATIALKPSLWCFCLCGTSWGAESDEELCYEHVSTSKLRPIPFKRAHILVPFIWAYVEDIWNPSMFFFVPSPLPFGGSTVEFYSRTSGESNHHQQSVSGVRVPAMDKKLCIHSSATLSKRNSMAIPQELVSLCTNSQAPWLKTHQGCKLVNLIPSFQRRVSFTSQASPNPASHPAHKLASRIPHLSALLHNKTPANQKGFLRHR